MPPQHKVRQSAEAEELIKKAKEIGERIRILMEKRGMDHKTLARAVGITPNAITKIVTGINTIQYAKLARLASVLGVEPNEILGYAPGAARELLRGVLEGAFQALGHSVLEANEIALKALEVLDTPSADSNSEVRGRNVAEFVIRQYLDSKSQ
jgi:transcriptional regulator with XRE-family HTH domain